MANFTTYFELSNDWFTTLDSTILNNLPMVGIGEVIKRTQFTVVPNPFSDQVTVTSNGNQPIQSYRIYDLGGNLVIAQNGLNAEKLTIDRGNMPAGMYFLELNSEKSVLGRQKIVVQ